MKKVLTTAMIIMLAAVILTMPVYAKDLKDGVNEVIDYGRAIAASVIEAGAIIGAITLFVKRAKWGAVGTFIFGSAFAALIAMPEIFKGIGEGIATLLK